MKAQKRRANRRRAIAGFTLLEILVVLIIIGVLVAIAAPSWSALLNRQRVNIVREQAAQVIRQAQAEAKRTKLARVVVFDLPTNGVPRVATQRSTLDADERKSTRLDATQISAITTWEELGKGEVKAGQILMSTAPAAASNQIVFDSNGAVDPVSVSFPTPPNAIFTVNVRPKGTSVGANRCVIVGTLLGATRTAEGATDCPT